FETSVERVDRATDSWQLTTSRGTILARQVVIATGFDCLPYVRQWPGIESFGAPVLHSSEYRNAAPFRGRDVLVVGAGSSGTEIALDLAEGGAGRVAIAIRTHPLLLAREWLGIPVSVFSLLARLSMKSVRDVSARLLSRAMFGDLSSYGIERSGQPLSEMIARGRLPTVDAGFVDAVRERHIRVVAALERFDGSEVVLADGSRLSPDCVIAATAYRGGLEPMLSHLGVVGDDGRPRLDGGPQNSSAPGLYFVGYRTALTGHLSPIRSDARHVARAIARQRCRVAPAGRKEEQPPRSPPSEDAQGDRQRALEGAPTAVRPGGILA
ncbi:MAG: NAD(P)-binding domain-containing protein, partial [Actinomycetota bacterium]|nr:NAD(P)-binding domain-containing protein [Actinomycetota bacterium]